ncbi:MAG: ATP-binding cassette domain-containing protein [Hyphomicrobiaceae bacterium]
MPQVTSSSTTPTGLTEPPSCAHGAAVGHDHGHGYRIETPIDPDSLFGVRDLSLTRSGRTILSDVDLDLGAGEVVTLIGPNGAGKTTLVKVLLGLEKADTGVVHKRAGLRIGYVPQRVEIDPTLPMTASRFLALANDVDDARIKDVLQTVGAGKVFDRQLAKLSGGELQRVVFARALLRNPDVLVLDEPVSGVDHVGEAELYELIAKLRETRGLGVLLVSHDLHVVMASSDRVICLNQHVCCSGKPIAVAKHAEYARLFGHEAAKAFAIYEHHHDHTHDLSGRPTLDEPGA